MKTILYHSNNSRAFTGFGKHCKNILKYLHKTGKYKIIEFANGSSWSDPVHNFKPWKCVGTLPDDKNILRQLNADPNRSRAAGYGGETIDQAITEFKPDIYIGVEDIWAFGGYWEKPWWNKINHMIWTTLDSQPILPQALEAAPRTKNFFTWASFAEKDMAKAGHGHVKTLHGTVNTEDFHKLSDIQRHQLKEKHGLLDAYVIGFVFRNQLRKSVPNILDGFKMFKKDCPKAKLLLHTHWSEGWDIPRLIQEKEIDPKDILTTYFCKNCFSYEIRPFTGQEQNCSSCGSEKSLNTTNVTAGVDEEQLNEIYNMMDVYCHPFTSGGMEIPIFEAKLTELPTLVTNYSCGEDSCTPESGGFALDWAEYREPGTQFIKASTYPASIAKQLKKVWKMKPEKLKQIGEKARKFTIENYSIEAVGKKLEEILDGMPDVSLEDSDLSSETKQDFANLLDDGKRIGIVIPQSAGDILWVNSLIDNLNKLYPDYDIYVVTKSQFAPYIEDHPHVYKVLEYNPSIDVQSASLEGAGLDKGYFDIAFAPHTNTQKHINYTHNALDKTEFELYDS